ncbi:hypothetical protein L596_013654 [Steinernema carpocapsae]|uniref:TIL domain-containing protein n=1 Tax=Steinernema carpocapsae TaxID=34508 RepID=A0A4U5P1P9_STECR|nr:hypothetical protein L596_013654 [Steinernema carpocapsae]
MDLLVFILVLLGPLSLINAQTSVNVPAGTSSASIVTQAPLASATTSRANQTSDSALTCGTNERVTTCLPCEQQCDAVLRNLTTVCLNPLCFTDGPQFCECPINGTFARNSDGQCVPSSQCPTPTCPSGQQWSKNPCDGTCEVPQPNCTFFGCMGPGCACKSGYVRFFGQCILQSSCPSTKKQTSCGECPAGQICKREHSWFGGRWSARRGGKNGRGEHEGNGECTWYDPCGLGLSMGNIPLMPDNF